MKKALIAITLVLISGAALFINFHPLILSGRVLSPPLNASIKVDGEERPTARVFAMTTSFDGKPIDSLVLWIPDSSISFGRAIIIVDKANHEVGMPNSNIMDYDLLWDTYLFQSEDGSRNAPFAKGEGYEDPQLALENSTIKFTVHTMSPYLAGKKIEVDIKTSAV
jgi:hypothetical protein